MATETTPTTTETTTAEVAVHHTAPPAPPASLALPELPVQLAPLPTVQPYADVLADFSDELQVKIVMLVRETRQMAVASLNYHAAGLLATINMGERLSQLRKIWDDADRKDWEQFCKKKIGLSSRQCLSYMKVYANRDRVLAALQHDNRPTLNKALAMAAGLKLRAKKGEGKKKPTSEHDTEEVEYRVTIKACRAAVSAHHLDIDPKLLKQIYEEIISGEYND